MLMRLPSRRMHACWGCVTHPIVWRTFGRSVVFPLLCALWAGGGRGGGQFTRHRAPDQSARLQRVAVHRVDRGTGRKEGKPTAAARQRHVARVRGTQAYKAWRLLGSDIDGRHQTCTPLGSVVKEGSFSTSQPNLPSLSVVVLPLFRSLLSLLLLGRGVRDGPPVKVIFESK